MQVQSATRLFYAIFLVLLAGAARAEPTSVPSDAPLAQAGRSLAAPMATAFPARDWWTGFGDPALSALVEEGLAGSPTVAAAVARMNAARSLAGQAEAALAPQFAVDASATGEKLSRNQIIPPQFVPDRLLGQGRITGRLSFDLDLWGRNRAALAAATSEARAAQVEADEARLLVASAIAESYYDLGRVAALGALARDRQRIADGNERLIGQRFEEGLETQGARSLAQARAASARGEALAAEEALGFARHALAALLGAGPDRGLAIVPPGLPQGRDLGLPDHLAADLLGRRPDIAAARLRAQAAGARVKSAKAAFFPDINLTALAGLQAIGLDKLFDSGSTITSFGPALHLPLFGGGALRANLGGARARQSEAIAVYDATLLGALREVADLVTRKQLLVERQRSARRAVEASTDAWHVMELRYRHGLANQLELLAAEDANIAAKRQALAIVSLDIASDIALIRALGGGFGEPETGMADNRQ